MSQTSNRSAAGGIYTGPVIDSHHHLWEWQKYPWLAAPMTPKMYGNDYSGLRQDYLVGDLVDDFGDNNVVKSVHVQANHDPSNPVGETEWLQAVATGAAPRPENPVASNQRALKLRAEAAA